MIQKWCTVKKKLLTVNVFWENTNIFKAVAELSDYCLGFKKGNVTKNLQGYKASRNDNNALKLHTGLD